MYSIRFNVNITNIVVQYIPCLPTHTEKLEYVFSNSMRIKLEIRTDNIK